MTSIREETGRTDRAQVTGKWEKKRLTSKCIFCACSVNSKNLKNLLAVR